jgi:UDP:flavonoid glycosyltransferase YjiC (YdhE family)
VSRARTRVLFLAEAVTLAHAARANVLARTLDPERYEVHAAWDPRYNGLLGDLPFAFQPVSSLPTEVFLARVATGVPMHDVATLRRYIRDDLRVIRNVSPDLIVADFRLSVAASARLSGVPVLALVNAYWSPYARQTFLFPEYEYPLSGWLGDTAARALFRLFRGIGFAAHCRPLNIVLKEHGLPSIGSDIRVMYTWGDHVAYCDIPELMPTWNLPPTHSYIGPVLWSPSLPMPEWWGRLPERPVVYVTLGSSGQVDMLPLVLDALAPLDVTVVAATAGRVSLQRVPSNACVADFIPGADAAKRASLVICNGGSPTTYQALAAGVPVLGLVSNNMDQHLNMEGVVRAHAGEVCGARGATRSRIRALAGSMLADSTYATASRHLGMAIRGSVAESSFPRLIQEITKG